MRWKGGNQSLSPWVPAQPRTCRLAARIYVCVLHASGSALAVFVKEGYGKCRWWAGTTGWLGCYPRDHSWMEPALNPHTSHRIRMTILGTPGGGANCQLASPCAQEPSYSKLGRKLSSPGYLSPSACLISLSGCGCVVTGNDSEISESSDSPPFLLPQWSLRYRAE